MRVEIPQLFWRKNMCNALHMLVPIPQTPVTPTCPSCGSSNHLWEDNCYEGCHRCDYLGDGKIIRHGDMTKAREYDLRP